MNKIMLLMIATALLLPSCVNAQTKEGSMTKFSNPDDGPNGRSWFSALAEFRQNYDPTVSVSPDRALYISPYLEYYAKKHNLDPNSVGSVYRNLDYDKPEEIKSVLKKELPKLAELEREFKRMFPERPNTGKGFSENPAIWDDILTNRDAYFKAVVADLANQGLSDIDKARLSVYTEDAQKTLDQAKSFTPGRNWYVGVLNDSRNEYLMAAISPSERKQLEEKLGHFYPHITKLLDEIAKVAAKTLPLYKPVGYNVKNAAEEKLLRTAVNDLAQAKVLQTGMMESTWTVSKNNYNIPTVRFKHGMIHAQYPKTVTDDGYCRIIYVNILQDYIDNGKYGASYAVFIKSEPAGSAIGK
jgi:hypothetical protein